MEINKLFSTSGAQDIFLWEWKCGAVDYNCISTTLKELTNAYIVIEAGPKIDSPKSGISPLLDNVILNQLLKTISEIHLRPHAQQILGESVNSNTCFAKAKYPEICQFSVHVFPKYWSPNYSVAYIQKNIASCPRMPDCIQALVRNSILGTCLSLCSLENL